MSDSNQNAQNVVSPTCHASVGTNFLVNEAAQDSAGGNSAIYPTVLRRRLKTLEQILDVLRGSTIAEERGKDVESKFWATYKRVSNEYDDDFLERANDDMAIILVFAGLFSAVNSTFIVGTQPNPADTTNILMLELIKIVADPNAVNDIGSLSSSTGFSSPTVWMQTLLYASLSFSLLAAFGAVMGKQWLNSYKAARGRGSLQERGLQRQRKLDGLERWRLQTVLASFLVLLQISLLLFGLSLSAYMLTQSRTISSVIICTTAFGFIFYVATILISVMYPDSPFQTAGSTLIKAICKGFSEFIRHRLPDLYHFFRNRSLLRRLRSAHTLDKYGKLSAIRWILETSTNPEVVEAAAEMVPRMQWLPKLDSSIIYERIADNFATCVIKSDLSVTYGKAMAHLCIQSESIPYHLGELDVWHSWGERSLFIRDAFMDAHLAYGQLKNTEDRNAQWNHKANIRIALRTMIVHGIRSRLSHPDEESMIWSGDFRWRHHNANAPCSGEYDWLIDYLVNVVALDIYTLDGETEGDALLALSAMHGLGSSAKRLSYVKVLIYCLTNRPSRVRYTALRAVSDASEELASITSSSMPQGVDAMLLDQLSRALFTAIHPDHNPITRDSEVDLRIRCYLHLIFALVKNDEWCNRLTRDGHTEWCISLYDEVLASFLTLDKIYLAAILLCVDPASKDNSLNPSQGRSWTLIKRAWAGLYDNNIGLDEFSTIITVTRQHLPHTNDDVARAELATLAKDVQWTLDELKERQETRGWAEVGVTTLVDAALPTVQAFYNDLLSYTEHGSIAQVDSGLVGS